MVHETAATDASVYLRGQYPWLDGEGSYVPLVAGQVSDVVWADEHRTTEAQAPATQTVG